MTPSDWLLSRFDAEVKRRDKETDGGRYEEVWRRPLLSFERADRHRGPKYRWRPGVPHIYEEGLCR